MFTANSLWLRAQGSRLRPNHKPEAMTYGRGILPGRTGLGRVTAMWTRPLCCSSSRYSSYSASLRNFTDAIKYPNPIRVTRSSHGPYAVSSIASIMPEKIVVCGPVPGRCTVPLRRLE